MPRPQRVDFPGAWHYVTSTAVMGQVLFHDDVDRRHFIDRVAVLSGDFGLECHAYCLMGGSYHLILRATSPTLSVAIKRTNGLYARAFNRRHARSGALFASRFRSFLIPNPETLGIARRWLHDCPTRAGLCRLPEHWPWSSASAYAEGRAPDWLVINRFHRSEPQCDVMAAIPPWSPNYVPATPRPDEHGEFHVSA
ncbi:MAG: hypothetical protein NW216_01380 [Hyphomicrobium sp.]|nr:hypothetical protein [Hyphomicrobium sp.]